MDKSSSRIYGDSTFFDNIILYLFVKYILILT